MTEKGSALMGVGVAIGEHRATEAAKKAISSPLLETSIEGAKGVLMTITGSANISLYEVTEAAQIVRSAADEELTLIFGSVINDNLEVEIIVAVIATEFENEPLDFEIPSAQVMMKNLLKKKQAPPPPTEESKPQVEETPVSSNPEPAKAPDVEETMDIPSFLRRNNR
jgi:cell division protein FtsZ